MTNSKVLQLGLKITLFCMATNPAFGQITQRQGVLLKPETPTLLQRGAGCAVAQLNLRITTGNDDMRGGNDNLDVQVQYANGDMDATPNVNNGAYWAGHSVNTVSIYLKHPVAPDQIRQIHLVHSAQGGYNPPNQAQTAMDASPITGPVTAPVTLMEGIQTEDDWDMAELQVFGLGKGVNVPIASSGFHRFTGSNPSLDINAQPAGCPSGNQVARISFTFLTADDDLRGGNDNLNVTILFADGSNQATPNVNHSQNWPNGSTKGAEVLLNRLVTIDQIRGFTLSDTFTGGSGGDNWNMASMQADAVMTDGSTHTIAKFGFHRFSSDWTGPKAKQITIPAHPIN